MTTSVLILPAQAPRDPRRDGAIFDLVATLIENGSDPFGPLRSTSWRSSRNLPSDDPDAVLAAMRRVSRLQPATFPLYLLDVVLLGRPHLPKPLGQALLDRLIEKLGIEGHQVLALAHERGNSSYLRLFVLRLHPEMLRATRLPKKTCRNDARDGLAELLDSQALPIRSSPRS